MSKKPIYKKEVLKFEGHPFDIVVLYGGDANIKDVSNEVIQRVPELKGLEPESNDMYEALVIVAPRPCTSIFFLINNQLTIGVLAHEISHLTYECLQIHPTPHDDSTDEVYAYLQEHIFRRLYKLILNKFRVDPIKFLELDIKA